MTSMIRLCLLALGFHWRDEKASMEHEALHRGLGMTRFIVATTDDDDDH